MSFEFYASELALALDEQTFAIIEFKLLEKRGEKQAEAEVMYLEGHRDVIVLDQSGFHVRSLLAKPFGAVGGF